MTPSFPTRRASDLLSPDFYDGDPNFETFVRQQWSTGYEFEQPLSDLWTLRLNGRVHRSTLAYDSVYANGLQADNRSEEHTSELQSLMRTSYAVFCLNKKKNDTDTPETTPKH